MYNLVVIHFVSASEISSERDIKIVRKLVDLGWTTWFSFKPHDVNPLSQSHYCNHDLVVNWLILTLCPNHTIIIMI